MNGDVMAVREVSADYRLEGEKSSVPAGYKKTEMGLIPEDWKIKKISELSSVATGNTPPTNDRSNYGDEFLFASPTDMGKRKHIISTEKMLSKKGFSTSRKFPEKSVLFVCIGSTIGKCGIAPFEITSNQQINAVLPSDSFCSDFMYYALCFSSMKIKEQAGEQAVPLINKSQFSANKIALPPKSEQRAIATALSDVDALLEELDRLIAKKRDLKQAAMQQLLTGQTRLPGFEGEWKEVSIREVLTQSATYGIVTAGRFVSSGVKMVRGGDISDGRISIDLPMVSEEKSAEYQRTVLRENDIVIALVGYPGAAAVVPEELIGSNISRAVGLLRLDDNVDARFMTFFLNSPQGRKMVLAPSAGSAQQVVNLSALNKLRLTIPPINEQRAISERLDRIDEEAEALNLRRRKTSALKKAMMQELLTGRTRLL